MITMTFQSCSSDEMLLFILENNFNHSTQSYKKKSLILNAEIKKRQEQEMHVNKKWKEEK